MNKYFLKESLEKTRMTTSIKAKLRNGRINKQLYHLKKIKKSICFKKTQGNSGNNNKVATLSKTYCYMYHHAKFEIERTVLTCLD